MENNSEGTVIPLPGLYGLVTSCEPTDVPAGGSPSNQDVMYRQGGAAFTRHGLSRTYASPLSADLIYTKTYQKQDGENSTLVVDQAGNLYTEDVENAPGVLTPVNPGPAPFVQPGAHVLSVSASTREYITSFDSGPGGASVPVIWDGAALTRFTTDGPGTSPVATEQPESVDIVSITQPLPIGSTPEVQALSMGLTTIQFFENTSGVYSGAGTPKGTPYTNGNSLDFNQVIPGFPEPNFTHAEHRSPMSQQCQGPDGSWINDVFFPESATGGSQGYGFDANIQTTLTVTTPGSYTLYILGDDGFVFYLGDAAAGGGVPTYISGERSGPEPSSLAGNTYMAGRNAVAASDRSWYTFVVSFSAVGVYPLEIGWSNLSANTVCFLTVTWVQGVGPAGSGRTPIGNPLLPSGAAGTCVCTQSGNVVTVITGTPHPFGVGDQALLADFTPVDYNGLWTVTSVPSAIAFTFELDATTGLATGTGGTVAPVTATIVCETPHNLLVGDGVTITGNSVGLFNSGFDDTTVTPNIVNPGLWTCKAIIDPLTFQADMLQNSGGITGTGGVLGCGGLTAPGIHKVSVFYELEDGTLTCPSPLTQFDSTGNKKVTIFNLPIGPPNTVARCVAFTPSGGADFFYIPADVVGTQSTLGGITTPAIIGTATRVPDNTTLSATFDFSDESLTQATGISVKGNNLFAQLTLPPARGVIDYADRTFVFAGWNNVTNFLGMTMSAAKVIAGAPSGWTFAADDPSSGVQVPTNNQQYAWRIIGDGSASARGLITQGAYQDALSIPIIQPRVKYRFRAHVLPSAASLDGNLVVDLFSATGTITATVAINTVLATGGWVSGTFSSATPNQIPTDLLLRVYATGLATGAHVDVDNLQILPDNLPVLGTQILASYANARTQFDGVTGKLIIPGNDPVTCMFTYKGLLHIATRKALYATSDAGSEPAYWSLDTVSDRVGAFSPFSVSAGEDRTLLVNRAGAWLLIGSNPVLISQEVSATFDLVNTKAAATLCWVENDQVNRRFFIGLPTGTNDAYCDLLLVCDYRSTQDEVDIPNALHMSQGKLSATDNSRKWSVWSIPTLFGKLVTRPDADDHMTFCRLGKGNAYTLDPTRLHDDDMTVPIPAWYNTSFFCTPEDCEQYSIGIGLHSYEFLQIASYGVGTLKVTPYQDSLNNPRKPLKPRPLTTGPSYSDREIPSAVRANRVSYRIEAIPATGSLDAHFSVRQLSATVTSDPFGSVRGKI